MAMRGWDGVGQWDNWYLRFLLLVAVVSADLCPEPVIPNGRITGEKKENMFFGEVTCDVGFHMVGASKTVKCRNGIWSQQILPVCVAIGSCPDLPHLHNGRNIPVSGARGSAYHFKCNRGYKRYGVRVSHCVGDAWSHPSLPVCTKNNCDKAGMLELPYGEGRALMGGAVYRYRCTAGEMEGSDTVVCTGAQWNTSRPHCNVEPGLPRLSLVVEGQNVTEVRAGDWVLVGCQAQGGHPLPAIGLSLAGRPTASKDFRDQRNSFSLEVGPEDDGAEITCTAANKVGQTVASTKLSVLSPPGEVKLTGPETVERFSVAKYECGVEGGKPVPELVWRVGGAAVQGFSPGPGRSSIELPLTEPRSTVTCLASNSLGETQAKLRVNTRFLPGKVEVTGPTEPLQVGDTAQFSCKTGSAWPQPALTWTVVTGEEVDMEKAEEVEVEQLDDGSVAATAKLSLDIEAGMEGVVVSCAASLEGAGELISEPFTVEILGPETTTRLATTERETTFTTQRDTTTTMLAEEETTTEMSAVAGPGLVRLVPELVEEEEEEGAGQRAEKPLWIPISFNSEVDLAEYQDSSYREKQEEPARAEGLPAPKAGSLGEEQSHAVGQRAPQVMSPYSGGASQTGPALLSLALALALARQ